MQTFDARPGFVRPFGFYIFIIPCDVPSRLSFHAMCRFAAVLLTVNCSPAALRPPIASYTR